MSTERRLYVRPLLAGAFISVVLNDATAFLSKHTVELLTPDSVDWLVSVGVRTLVFVLASYACVRLIDPRKEPEGPR